MQVSVQEASARLDLTPSRVRVLVAANQLDGMKIGRTWVVDAASIEARKRRMSMGHTKAVRPMSPRTAWSAALLCDDPGAETPLSPSERSRTLARLRRVATSEVGVIHSWMARRASTTRTFKVPSRDLAAIIQTEGVIPTGVNAAAEHHLDLSPRGEAHVYAATPAVAEQLIRDYWLIESVDGNLTASVPAVPVPRLSAAPRLICAADLVAQAHDIRTLRVATTLIDDALSSLSR